MSFRISHPDVEGTTVVPERTLGTYAGKGWVIDDRLDNPGTIPGAAPAPRQIAQPTKSASAASWKTYAVVSGMPYEQAMAATRDELAEHYQPTPKAETPAKTAPKES